MKALLFFLSKTDIRLVRHCSSYAKNVQATLGFFVLLTGALAFISGTYAISNMFLVEGADGAPVMEENGWSFSIALGVLYSFFIMAIDREIVSASNKLAVLFRIPLAIIIGLIVSLPIELKLFEGRIVQEIREVDRDKEKLDKSDATAKLKKLETEKDTLKKKVANAQREETYWSRVMEEETAGRVKKGRTGKKGRGPAYEEAKRNMELQKERIIRFENELQKLDSLIAKAGFERDAVQSTPQPYDLLTKYIFLKKLTGDKNVGKSVKTLSRAITILFLLFELIPALIKLIQPKTEYDELVEGRRLLNIRSIERIRKVSSMEYNGMEPDEIERKNPINIEMLKNTVS